MCDTLCVLTDEGTLFAKASDRPFGEAQVVEAFPARRAGGTLRTQYLGLLDHGSVAFLAGRPTWLWGVEHGVNEHRVAVGNERVWTVDDPEACDPALVGMDLVRLALERATDAEAAVDLITALVDEHGQGGVGELTTGEAYFSSFLVADPTEAWIVETSGRTWAAKPVDRHRRGAAISNRLTIETEWTRASRDVPPGANFQRWRDPEYPTPHADQRIAATAGLARRDPAPTARELVGVLRHHGDHAWGVPGAPHPPGGIDPIPGPKVSRDGTGVSICMHLRDWESTTGAMITELPADPDRPSRAWVVLANPCTGVFVPVFPPDVVPAAWADPAVWARFDELRHVVEDRPGALADVRAVLDPVEDALWDEADELVAAADVAGQRGFVDRAATRVLGALAEVEALAHDLTG